MIRRAVQRVRLLRATLSLAAVAALMASAGCPNGEQSANLTVLFTSGEVSNATKQGVVDLGLLDSLEVTLEEVVLRPAAGSMTDEVIVFTGPLTVNLLDIVGISDVLATVVVPTGTYEEVVLVISTANATFTADPLTPVPVNLPNGGILTVAVSLTVGEEGTLLIGLGGVELIEETDGSFTLNPTLGAELDEEPVLAQAVGTIQALNTTTGTFTLVGEGGELGVAVGSAIIFLPGDFDVPNGTLGDLQNNHRVLVLGLLNPDGTIDAQVIVIVDSDADGDGVVTVNIDDFMFTPMEVVIQEGHTVRWVSRTETTHTVTSGDSPDDPEVGLAFDILFEGAGSMADVTFDDIKVRIENGEALKGGVIVTEADLRIVTEAEVVEVENAPFDVENGAAVFDYFSAPYFEDGMTGKVLVIPRGPRHGDDDDDDDRVTICHIPPGNPSAAHTIRVGRAAVAAHLAHGDVLGRCDDRDDDDDDDDDDD